MKDFTGFTISSTCPSVAPFNGKIIEQTIEKAFPKDDQSTLYIVKAKDVIGELELYEDEMCKK